MLMLSLSCWKDHSSDQALREKFFAHRSEFDELLTLARSEAGFGRVAPEFVHQRDFITDERWNEYRVLFSRIGLERGINIGSDRVVFIASAKGMFSAGSSKGYVYSEKRLGPLVRVLDEAPAGRNGLLYAPLEDNWYLYLEWGD